MRIGEIKTVTRDYRTTKGNLYQIVSVEMLDIPEDMQCFYKPVMYGTINHDHIDANGKLNQILSLAKMCIRDTIPHAIESREDAEACDGMTLEEIVAYYGKKFAE